jgi:hypothetical protein
MTSTGANGLVASTVAGLVYVFINDGLTYQYHLYDTIPVAAITASTTLAPFHFEGPYSDFKLKAAYTARCSQSVAGNQSTTFALKVSVEGD